MSADSVNAQLQKDSLGKRARGRLQFAHSLPATLPPAPRRGGCRKSVVVGLGVVLVRYRWRSGTGATFKFSKPDPNLDDSPFPLHQALTLSLPLSLSPSLILHRLSLFNFNSPPPPDCSRISRRVILSCCAELVKWTSAGRGRIRIDRGFSDFWARLWKSCETAASCIVELNHPEIQMALRPRELRRS